MIDTQLYVDDAPEVVDNISEATLRAAVYLNSNIFSCPEVGYDTSDTSAPETKRRKKDKETRLRNITKWLRWRDPLFKLLNLLQIKRTQDPLMKGWDNFSPSSKNQSLSNTQQNSGTN